MTSTATSRARSALCCAKVLHRSLSRRRYRRAARVLAGTSSAHRGLLPTCPLPFAFRLHAAPRTGCASSAAMRHDDGCDAAPHYAAAQCVRQRQTRARLCLAAAEPLSPTVRCLCRVRRRRKASCHACPGCYRACSPRGCGVLTPSAAAPPYGSDGGPARAQGRCALAPARRWGRRRGDGRGVAVVLSGDVQDAEDGRGAHLALRRPWLAL